MGLDMDWTLKMKPRTDSPILRLSVEYCDKVLSDLYHGIGYVPRHIYNGAEIEMGFETSSNYAYEDIPKLLRDITKEFPDVVMSFTCKAGPWDHAEKANVANGELEWLSAKLVYAEPMRVFY